ncbi:MAG: NAD(P)/FAD-dependent oxidoreductase [Hyphomicrobiaceae bacterium]
MNQSQNRRPSVAVIGTGISGMSAAWLLAPHVDLAVYECAGRIGGHSNTVNVCADGKAVAVDTGFIVYNEPTYPNLKALLEHFNVRTDETNMSFAASLRGGRCEYSGESPRGLFAQKANALRPRFWRMLYDLQKFYRTAPAAVKSGRSSGATLREFVAEHGYSTAFVEDHLLPLSAAIWSAPPGAMLDYPVEAFVRFHENHGLLKFVDRPIWRTVSGGSRAYVEKLTAEYEEAIVLHARLEHIRRVDDGVEILDRSGSRRQFDHVIFATHADQALRLLADPSTLERRLLAAFRYSCNEAYLHSDADLMPRLRSVWASWNFMGTGTVEDKLTVTYWMNNLQRLDTSQQLFVTLNPQIAPRDATVHKVEAYEHPLIDRAAIDAQKQLWSLQGVDGTWFCGAYFGAGFHEDGLQAGLAVAEQLAVSEGLHGVRRPWRVEAESGRIHVRDFSARQPGRLAA